MPSRLAVWVMRWANAASEPETFSASATAASLAERATSDWIACSTVIEPPTPMPSFEGGALAACCEKATGVTVVRRPAFIAACISGIVASMM